MRIVIISLHRSTPSPSRKACVRTLNCLPRPALAAVLSWPATLRLLLLACLLGAAALAHAGPAEDRAQSVIHMLDYVSVDYPEFVQDGKVLNEEEYAEQREFATQSLAVLQQLPANPQQAALVAQARELLARIEAKAPGTEVSRRANTIAAGVVRAWQLTVAPRHAPDLARAATLFQAQCAACHGPQGRGDGPAAAGMEPPASNFHDGARMDQRSLYGLYNTITLGVGGTPMRGFSELSEDDRWALAFLAGGLRADPATLQRGEALWAQGHGQAELGSFRALVTAAPGALRQQGGAELDAVRAWLTAHPEAMAAAQPAPLDFARSTLADALAAYRAGDAARARQLAITAYLEGFELVEAALDNVDGALRAETEHEMMALRNAIGAGVPADEVAQQVGRITTLLDRADERLGGDGMSAATAFASSLLILLREGLEAILVLAAVIAFVRKTGRSDALPWIHAGWIAAVALGGLTWYAANHLIAISGAGRELTEGVAALLAAAMLLYVGFWLHRRSSASAWQGFVREQVTAALGQRTLWAMAGVSFLAVYRELFEIVLFYQTLWLQAGSDRHDAVRGGAATAAVLLAVLGWAILRFSVRLPIGPFFAATAGLLLLLAFVFVGHGVAALQEAGALAFTPARFVNWPLLGIRPSVQGLGAQAAVLALIVLALLAGRRGARAMA